MTIKERIDILERQFAILAKIEDRVFDIEIELKEMKKSNDDARQLVIEKANKAIDTANQAVETAVDAKHDAKQDTTFGHR